MTIERVKINWGPNEELTSDQQNAVDTNATYALDKRQGETDTLSSSVTVDGYGEIILALGSDVTHESGSTDTYDNGSTVNLNGLTYFDGVSVHNAGDSVGWLSGSTEEHLSGNVDHYASGAIMINDGYGEFADLRISGTSKVNYTAPRSYTRHFAPTGYNGLQQGTEGSFGITTNEDVSSSGSVNVFLDLGQCGIPNGATITSLTSYYRPPSGHVALPTEPRMYFLRHSLGVAMPPTTIASVFSLSLDVPSYEVYTNLPILTSYVLDFDNYMYTVVLRTERGINALTGTQIFGFSVSFTSTHMNDY